jgi:hypothetical protein
MHSLPLGKYNRNFLTAFLKAIIENAYTIEDKLIQKMKGKIQEETGSIYVKKIIFILKSGVRIDSTGGCN